MRLASTSVNDIGIYNVKMNIVQDSNDSKQGFNNPFRGTIASASYSFVVTVNPCLMGSISISSAVLDV